MKFIKRNYNYLIFTFFFVSIMCWFLEIGYSLIVRDKFVLPGVWYGPYCPIYGLCFVVLLLVVKKKDNFILNIVKTFIIATVIEYSISFISDKFFNDIIWDYSNRFLNINGRVCLDMSLMFTVLGLIMIYVIEPITDKIYKNFKDYIKYTNIVFAIGFICDVLYTLIK